MRLWEDAWGVMRVEFMNCMRGYCALQTTSIDPYIGHRNAIFCLIRHASPIIPVHRYRWLCWWRIGKLRWSKRNMESNLFARGTSISWIASFSIDFPRFWMTSGSTLWEDFSMWSQMMLKKRTEHNEFVNNIKETNYFKCHVKLHVGTMFFGLESVDLVLASNETKML